MTMKNEDNTVTITVEQFNEFQKAWLQLNHLINNGVDNWRGYSHYFWDEEEDEE